MACKERGLRDALRGVIVYRPTERRVGCGQVLTVGDVHDDGGSNFCPTFQLEHDRMERLPARSLPVVLHDFGT